MGQYLKYSDANNKFQDLIKGNQILFPKFNYYNSKESDFELVLLGPPEGKHIDHIRDEKGSIVFLQAKNGRTIKKIEKYYVEEKFKHKNSGKKIDFKQLIKIIILGKKGFKTYYAIQNKVVVEYFDNQNVDLFVLKSKNDATRLVDTIKNFYYANNLLDAIFFSVVTKETKKKLYIKIYEKLGVDEHYMHRLTTK